MIVSVSVAAMAVAVIALALYAMRVLHRAMRTLDKADAGIAELRREWARTGRESARLARASRRLVQDIRSRADDWGPLCRTARRTGEALGRATDTALRIAAACGFASRTEDRTPQSDEEAEAAACGEERLRSHAAAAAEIAALGVQLWQKMQALREAKRHSNRR